MCPNSGGLRNNYLFYIITCGDLSTTDTQNELCCEAYQQQPHLAETLTKSQRQSGISTNQTVHTVWQNPRKRPPQLLLYFSAEGVTGRDFHQNPRVDQGFPTNQKNAHLTDTKYCKLTRYYPPLLALPDHLGYALHALPDLLGGHDAHDVSLLLSSTRTRS